MVADRRYHVPHLYRVVYRRPFVCSISDNNLKRGFHKFIYKTLWSKIAEVNMFVRCTWFTCLLCMHVATCVR